MKYLIHVGPGIGDMMQFFSMARDIKEQDPNSRVDFIMRGNPLSFMINNQLMECQDYADHLYWYSINAPLHLIKLVCQLLFVGKYDYGIVHIKNISGKKSLWLYRIMRFLRCKRIIGSGYKKLDIVVSDDNMHYLEYHASLLNAVGIKGNINPISIKIEKLNSRIVETLDIPLNAKVVGISIGTNIMKWKTNGLVYSYDVKSWPYDRWIQLAERLSKKGIVVFVMGGRKEYNEINELRIKITENTNLINFIGKTSIKESLALVGRCDLMVGSEGGMMHCAAALGIKTLTIFGGTDPKKWNPGGPNGNIVFMNYNCGPCFITNKAIECKEHKCLIDITIDMVENRILNLI